MGVVPFDRMNSLAREVAFQVPLALPWAVKNLDVALMCAFFTVGYILRGILFSYLSIAPWESVGWTGFWVSLDVLIFVMILKRIGSSHIQKRFEQAKRVYNQIGSVLSDILQDFNESHYD